MRKVFDYFKNIKIVYLYVLILLFLALSITMTTLFITKKTVVKKTIKLISNEEKKEDVKTVKVDVKGNVVTPGVYELADNSRVIDAIASAGGLLEDSNTELINLSQKLKDEMTIIVYSNKEIEDYKKNNKKEVVTVEVLKCPDNINDACINKSKTDNSKTNTENGLISINSATMEELQSLTGIGESKANAIIEYREKNGNFNSIEDLKNVTGIGDALFEKVKDSITI